MHYVISDIHGCYAQFTELLELIHFKDTDILYVLGDIVDRGPHPIKVLSALMELPNAVCIVGNHELMAIDGLRFLNTQITNESIESMDKETMGNLFNWALLKKLSDSEKQQYIKYPLSFLHKIWYNTHIADDPKIGAFYKKTANLRGVEVCTSTKTVHK